MEENVQNEVVTAPAAPVENVNLNPQQALSVLIQGVQFAQSKGVFSLEDAELIAKAVRVFVTKPAAAPADAQPEQPPVDPKA